MSSAIFKRIAVFAHPEVPEAVHDIDEISASLQQEGYQILQGLFSDYALLEEIKTGEFDLMIAMGGDGTMLRAGHLCGPLDIPILGINMGSFGFLTEVQNGGWPKVLPRLVAGDFWLEERMMLHAALWREGRMIGEWDVLNEIVISRGHSVRPVHLVATVDDRLLTTFVADGLIAATPTGSTAYALAAGGPILPPGLRNILLVAVAPHLSLDRAIVLSEGSKVCITIHAGRPATLSPDGQEPILLQDNDRVEAYAGQHTVHFLRFQDPGYFYRNLTPHMSQNPVTGKLNE